MQKSGSPIDCSQETQNAGQIWLTFGKVQPKEGDGKGFIKSFEQIPLQKL